MIEASKVMPSEWSPQAAIVVGFPSHHALWPGTLLRQAQCEVAALCNTIAPTQTCYVLVAKKSVTMMFMQMIIE